MTEALFYYGNTLGKPHNERIYETSCHGCITSTLVGAKICDERRKCVWKLRIPETAFNSVIMIEDVAALKSPLAMKFQ